MIGLDSDPLMVTLWDCIMLSLSNMTPGATINYRPAV